MRHSGKNTKPYLSVWSKWCYGTSFPFSLFIRPVQLVSLTILLSILNTTSFPLFHVSKLRLPLSDQQHISHSLCIIPNLPFSQSHTHSATGLSLHSPTSEELGITPELLHWELLPENLFRSDRGHLINMFLTLAPSKNSSIFSTSHTFQVWGIKP